jgi:hypothetical protein
VRNLSRDPTLKYTDKDICNIYDDIGFPLHSKKDIFDDLQKKVLSDPRGVIGILEIVEKGSN